MTPAGVIRPTFAPYDSVNQRLPSGPAVIEAGWLPDVGMAYLVTVPLGVMRPTRFASVSVNHTLPSGPAVTPCGEPLADIPLENSVTPVVPTAMDAIVVKGPVLTVDRSIV